MVGLLVACGRPSNRSGSATDVQVHRTSPLASVQTSPCPAGFVAKFLETRLQSEQLKQYQSKPNELHFAKLCMEFIAFNISSCRVACEEFRAQGENNNLAAMALCPSNQGRIWTAPNQLMAACGPYIRVD